jgi:hypothetical protein
MGKTSCSYTVVFRFYVILIELATMLMRSCAVKVKHTEAQLGLAALDTVCELKHPQGLQKIRCDCLSQSTKIMKNINMHIKSKHM